MFREILLPLGGRIKLSDDLRTDLLLMRMEIALLGLADVWHLVAHPSRDASTTQATDYTAIILIVDG